MARWGSEGESYVETLEREAEEAAERIATLESSLSEQAVFLTAAEQSLRLAEARIATLEALLTPFAEAAKLLPDHPDGADVEYVRYLTVRLPNQLRAVAKALEAKQ